MRELTEEEKKEYNTLAQNAVQMTMDGIDADADNGKELRRIEHQLEQIMQSDKKEWVAIYELMERVDEQKLFLPSHRSFSAWVRHIASKLHCHESLLWSRKKAGAYYKEYQRRASERGLNKPNLSDIHVDAENLNLIEKIARNDDERAEKLLQKVMDGELKRRDLKSAWDSAKSKRADNPRNGYEKKRMDAERAQNAPDGLEKALRADDIVLSLVTNKWLKTGSYELTEHEHIHKRVYHTLTEFPVRSGSSHHARRIDVLCIENQTERSAEHVCLHGIEIKADKNDLLNDHKTSEYADYVDYIWFAIPNSLLEYAEDVKGDGWGIIVVDDDGNASINTMPTRINPVMKEDALHTALIKIL